MVEITTVPLAIKIKEHHYGDDSTAGHMVHEITKGAIVTPRRKVTNI